MLAGSTTLARVAYLNSVVREAGQGKRDDVLAQVARLANRDQRLGPTLEGLFYSRSPSETEAVRRQYEGTKQWMKAPNGEPTKLNEGQWLQVRPPSFKAWFGD